MTAAGPSGGTLEGRSVAVIGGGIGGLAAARALALRGAQVTVFEQAAELTEVGAGLQISPNGVAVLAALGLADRVAPLAERPEAAVLACGLSGRDILRVPLNPGIEARHGHPYWQLHRADLLAVLADGAREAGVRIWLGARVEGVVSDREGTASPGSGHDPTGAGGPGAAGTAAGGGADPGGGGAPGPANDPRSARTRHAPVRPTGPGLDAAACDLVVAADGIRSVLRTGLVAPGRPPAYAGYAAWRALIPAEGSEVEPVARIHMGPGRHVVVYPLRGGRLINIVAVEARGVAEAEGWLQADEPRRLREAFRGWAPGLTRLLERVESCYLWGLYDHPPLPRWHRDGVVLLGDAAHPTLPFLAQGATQALEDAWMLAACLDAEPDSARALEAYQAARLPRASRVQAIAARNARLYHVATPGLRPLLHGILRVGGRLLPGFAGARFDWLYGHDPVRAAPGGRG